MGKKLYVGNLPYSMTTETLTDAFTEHGTVEYAKVITDRNTNRSKGFGFVEMSSEDEAQNAIEKMNGVEVGGRALNVNIAKPQAPRPNRGHNDDYGNSRY